MERDVVKVIDFPQLTSNIDAVGAAVRAIGATMDAAAINIQEFNDSHRKAWVAWQKGNWR